MTSVFVVEDNPDASEIIESCLKGCGHDVTVCADVESAMAFIDQAPGIDIAFVDYWLVDKSAEPVLRALHMNYPEIPVVLITGGSAKVSIETTKWLGSLDGIQGFLQKPFSVHEIIAIASKVE